MAPRALEIVCPRRQGPALLCGPSTSPLGDARQAHFVVPQCLSPVSLGSLAPLGLRGFVIRDSSKSSQTRVSTLRRKTSDHPDTRCMSRRAFSLRYFFSASGAWRRLKSKGHLEMQLNSRSSCCVCPSHLSAPLGVTRRLRPNLIATSARWRRRSDYVCSRVLPRRTRTLPPGLAMMPPQSATKKNPENFEIMAGSANMARREGEPPRI